MFKFTKNIIFCIFIAITFIIIKIIINQYSIETKLDEVIMYGIDEENIDDAINKTEIWQIEIPKIYLIEQIIQGTTKEILIKNKYNQFEKIYEVEKCRIIRRDELEYLEQTEDNMLTIITYVENQPEYRRCIQAIEKEE